MKTTVEIPDALLREAKNYAARRGMTLKEVLETGLRQVLESERPARPFKDRKSTRLNSSHIQKSRMPSSA